MVAHTRFTLINQHTFSGWVGLPSSPDAAAATCNSHCSCDYVKYSPVCGEDGRTYISACHAGCRDEVLINDKKVSERFRRLLDGARFLGGQPAGRRWNVCFMLKPAVRTLV